MDSKRIKYIHEQLDFYQTEINQFQFDTNNTGTGYSSESSKDFLILISDFMHSAISFPEVNSLLQDVLDSYQHSKESEEIKEITKYTIEEINALGHILLTLPKWNDFVIEQETNNYSHPFNHSGYLKVNELPDLLISLASFQEDIIKSVDNLTDILVDARDGLNGIVDKYLMFDSEDVEANSSKISAQINKIRTHMNKLQEVFNYNPRFNGVPSIQEIYSIYTNIHPNPASIPDANNRFIYHLLVLDGLRRKDIENIKKSIRKVMFIIKRTLNNLISKRVVINRFRAFCELYDVNSILDEISSTSDKEKALQRRWEMFCFNSGYYPISEAHLGSGNFDTLIQSEFEQALLTEVKQVGFSGNITSASIIRSLRSARVQSENYKNRLVGKPLDRQVYIILFSGVHLNVTCDHVEKNGINFQLISIVITRIPDSLRSRNEIDININDII